METKPRRRNRFVLEFEEMYSNQQSFVWPSKSLDGCATDKKFVQIVCFESLSKLIEVLVHTKLQFENDEIINRVRGW